MRKIFIFIILLFTQWSCLNEKRQAEKILQHYIDQKVESIHQFYLESADALWDATVSGNEKDYQKLINIEFDFNRTNQNVSNLFAPDRLRPTTRNVFTNVEDFEMLKKLKFSGLITDTLLLRQLNVLYQAFMGPQIEPEKYKELTMNEIKLGQSFATIKVNLDGNYYGLVKCDSIRKVSRNSLHMKSIFDTMHQQGIRIVPDIMKMVNARNEFAVSFGYPNFYDLVLETKDQTPKQVKKILDEIEQKTRDPFFEAKRVIDKMLGRRFGIQQTELSYWHYNDERTSYLPESFTQKMDSLFLKIDPIQKTASFFEGIGLPIQNVIDNSDLEYRPEKASLTAMINVDFRNDIRLIAGIRNTYDGMYRMMHLGGHASHYNSVSDSIPFLLKTPIMVIYEGVAKYFENLVTNYDWLKNEVQIDEKKQKEIVSVCRHIHHVDRLFRCRRLLVMAEFEREIYNNPNQDLDSLWHQLNIKYLGITLPLNNSKSLWAANKFSTSLTCSIHNLVLADVFAAQLQHAIENNVLKKTNGVYTNNKLVGKYLIDKLYRHGNLLSWEELVENTTGETLNSSYLVEELTGDEND